MAFTGEWAPRGSESFVGRFAMQCKFTSKPNTSLRLSNLTQELSKATRLASDGTCDIYILITNHSVSGKEVERIEAAYLEIPGIKHCKVYGPDWIAQEILESKSLRRLVPQVYGLGDLSQILDERAQSQAREILESMTPELKKFVTTSSYLKAANALMNDGCVLLLGEPASGKSSIGAALALAASDSWGCSTFIARCSNDFIRHFNPQDPKQFFWIDDAFGATQLHENAVNGWVGAFPLLMAAIKKGSKILFTSRTYIFNAAKHQMKLSSFPLLADSQVVVDVANISPAEREQILYNHIRLGNQTKNFRTQLKPILSEVALHPNFSPEIARRLGDQRFTTELSPIRAPILDFVSRSLEFACDTIRSIEPSFKCALAMIFMRGGTLASPFDPTVEEQRAIEMLGGSISGITSALKSMDGGLVRSSNTGGHRAWRFRHPTLHDAVAAVFAVDQDKRDIYIAGASIGRMFSEVTCGEMDVRGVKVVIPVEFYDAFISRIQAARGTNAISGTELQGFLAWRCDDVFLEQFMATDTTFIDTIRLDSLFTTSTELAFILRLHETGLLPSSVRALVITAIRDLAIEARDTTFLHPRVRLMLTASEFDEIVLSIRRDLIPNLGHLIDECSGSGFVDEIDNPSMLYWSLGEFIQEIQRVVHDDAATDQISMALRTIDRRIIDYNEFGPDQRVIVKFETFSSVHEEARDAHLDDSIFGDVDE